MRRTASAARTICDRLARKGQRIWVLPQSSARSARFAGSGPVRPGLDSVEQAAEFHGLWGAVVTFPKRRPFATNLLLSSTLMPIADYNVQCLEGKKWDVRRTALFCAFGVYSGISWWLVYISLFRRIFPNAIRFANLPWAEKLKDGAGQLELVGQIAFDVLVYVPFFYFPGFYLFKAGLQGETLAGGMGLYRSNFVEDNLASFVIWIPGDFLCFTVPAWLRLPMSHVLSFSWNTLLSWMRGSAEVEASPAQRGDRPSE